MYDFAPVRQRKMRAEVKSQLRKLIRPPHVFPQLN